MQIADPLTKVIERDILVSFFNNSAFQSRFCLFAVNSYDPYLVEFFFVLRSSRIHLNTALSVFLMYQVFPLCVWFENYSGVSVNAGFTTSGRGRGSER